MVINEKSFGCQKNIFIYNCTSILLNKSLPQSLPPEYLFFFWLFAESDRIQANLNFSHRFFTFIVYNKILYIFANRNINMEPEANVRMPSHKQQKPHSNIKVTLQSIKLKKFELEKKLMIRHLNNRGRKLYHSTHQPVIKQGTQQQQFGPKSILKYEYGEQSPKKQPQQNQESLDQINENIMPKKIKFNRSQVDNKQIYKRRKLLNPKQRKNAFMTEQSQNCQDLKKNMSINQRHKNKKKSLSLSSHKSSQSLKQRKYKKEIQKNILKQLFSSVSIQIDKRSQQSICQLKNYLAQYHPFFKKISPLITNCILKLSQFYQVQKNKFIYQIGDKEQSFYIIVFGKIKLMNRKPLNMKYIKVCRKGQIFGEETLFKNQSKRKEKAVAIQDSLIIQIKCREYHQLKQQMNKFGYKKAMLEMQSLMKIQFIEKNWDKKELQSQYLIKSYSFRQKKLHQ